MDLSNFKASEKFRGKIQILYIYESHLIKL